METQNERTVVLNEVSNEEAGRFMEQQPKAIGNISGAVPKFKMVDGFTTFKAEYALVDNNLVIHFFGTPEHPVDSRPSNIQYWEQRFPDVLNVVGQDYFQATAPRLTAKYTEELKSWFFKAQGYEHILDIDAFVMLFFDLLDVQLEK